MAYNNNSNTGPAPRPGRLQELRQRPRSWLLFLAIFLYAASLVKFYVRDPLSTQTGPQGPIELILVTMAGLALLPCFRRCNWKPFVAPSAKAFVVFGAMAAVSSVFSYDPLLSFVKGLAFILVCGIAVVASGAFGSLPVVKCLYYSILAIVVAGLIVKLAGGGPLFAIEDFSGRARLSVFAWHPSVLADLCALALLSSLLLPKRPPIICQIFLFAINIATAARTSSALLVVVLLLIGLSFVRFTSRPSGLLFVGCCLGSLLALGALVGVQRQYHQSTEIALLGRALYGDNLDQEVTTLNGRTDVWDVAERMFSHSLFLGYGLDGARDVLINNTSWDAGNAHNSLIELILAGGFPATVVFLLGWAGVARRAWLSRGFLSIAALGIYAYIAGFGVVSPNLTYSQALPSFLIITIDTLVTSEGMSRARSVAPAAVARNTFPNLISPI